MVQWHNGMMQWHNTTMARWYDGSMIQIHDGTMAQDVKKMARDGTMGTKTQWHNVTMV